MKKLREYSLKAYTQNLSSKRPVPGGGSASALVGAVGAGLLSMVARYALGKAKTAAVRTRIKKICKESERIRKRLLTLVDHDAQAYLKLVQSRKKSQRSRAAARKKAREVPLETGVLCYEAICLSPDLVKYGSMYLLSDVEVAVELLEAAYNGALINVRINQ